MNDNDSERMLSFLKGRNYARTFTAEDADLIILNTCSIRDKAEHKVYSTLGRFKDLKRTNPGLVIGVGGCVAQQEGERLLARAPYLDMVFGPHNIHRLGELVDEVTTRRARLVATDQTDSIDPGEYSAAPEVDGVKAQVSIMRGCDNFCAYCIVPFTRGREVSRPSGEILREIETLVGKGVREVTLLGQNVNSYGSSYEGETFPGLIRRIARIQGLKRIRFVTSHPKDLSGELIRLFGEEEKLARHLHLPVQSGSDRVLEMMNRVYTREGYLAKAEHLRELYPDMSLTTDVIVGFPGETEEDFKATMELVEELRFDGMFSFMYSPRPGTKAVGFSGQVPDEVKSFRLKTLQARQREIEGEKNRALVGSATDVLVEGPSKNDPSELTGRTSCNRVVNFPGPKGLVGSVEPVTINEAYPNSLRGALHNERSL